MTNRSGPRPGPAGAGRRGDDHAVDLVVVGDCLLDRDVRGSCSRVTPDAPALVLDEEEMTSRPGGAGLAAVLAAADGHRVTLVTALSDDDPGAMLRSLLERAGVSVVDLGLDGPTTEKIRLRAGDVSLARWDRGRRTTAADVGPWSDAAQDVLSRSDGVLVSCYGRGITDRDDVRRAIAGSTGARPVVWDPHPHGGTPVRGVTLVTPSRAEAEREVPTVAGRHLGADTRRAETLVHRWQVGGCMITLGGDGALFTSGSGLPLVAPAQRVAGSDACGAGDRFAAFVAGQLAAGILPAEALVDAVERASAFVARGGAGSVRIGSDDPSDPVDGPGPTDVSGRPGGPGHSNGEAHLGAPNDVVAVAERVRARGGTVVATGGCFDLLHAGHVHALERARALGDCLVVCLNSDTSVRRLKGPDRPLVGQADRAEVLLALRCVDAVAVFDEDTPARVLELIRPDVFAKGGDYGSARIPEDELLAEWGGRAVSVPYLVGRSTSRLIEEMRDHA